MSFKLWQLCHPWPKCTCMHAVCLFLVRNGTRACKLPFVKCHFVALVLRKKTFEDNKSVFFQWYKEGDRQIVWQFHSHRVTYIYFLHVSWYIFCPPNFLSVHKSQWKCLTAKCVKLFDEAFWGVGKKYVKSNWHKVIVRTWADSPTIEIGKEIIVGGKRKKEGLFCFRYSEVFNHQNAPYQ